MRAPFTRRKKPVRRPDLLAEAPPRQPAEDPFIKDPQNFGLLVERYQSLLFRYIYGMFHDYHLAQDLVQEIFIKVYLTLDEYNVKYPFSTWLLRVGHNYSIDYRRKRRLEFLPLDVKVGDSKVSDSLIASTPSAARPLEQATELDSIKEVVHSLDSDYKAVLLLRYVEDVKLEDIAYVLGIPLGTVKSRINRARLILARRLSEREEKSGRDGNQRR